MNPNTLWTQIHNALIQDFGITTPMINESAFAGNSMSSLITEISNLIQSLQEENNNLKEELKLQSISNTPYIALNARIAILESNLNSGIRVAAQPNKILSYEPFFDGSFNATLIMDNL